MQNHTLLFLVLWPMFGGLLSYIAGRFNRRARDYLADIVCLVELGAAITSYKHIGAELSISGVCGLGISFTLDGFRYIYSVIIAFMWAATTIFTFL